MNLVKSLADLFYPPVCMYCGNFAPASPLCTACTTSLPHTQFSILRHNPVENVFAGRLAIAAAFSEFYFSKNKMVQSLIHQLKYRGSREAGIFLGECMGRSILASPFFKDAEILVPLPLHPKKEHKRGYNQSAIICEGITSVTGLKTIRNAIVRTRHSETQTRKHRTERWRNVDGIFAVQDANQVRNRNVILVDDVITTGATLESCGRAILQLASSLCIATAAHASK